MKVGWREELPCSSAPERCLSVGQSIAWLERESMLKRSRSAFLHYIAVCRVRITSIYQ